jgi:hypothetical protein
MIRTKSSRIANNYLRTSPPAITTTVGTPLIVQKETGVRFTLVPYRGFAPELQDLIAGRIDFFFDTPLQLPLTRAGNIKAYGVTSDARLAQWPDVPTLSEMGLPSVSYSPWGTICAQERAAGAHRQAQCGDRGSAGRSGSALSAYRSRV